jgi:hypothetical protein
MGFLAWIVVGAIERTCARMCGTYDTLSSGGFAAEDPDGP